MEECLGEEGYAVDATGPGAEGLWYAENHDYDVLLLDIMLLEMSGLEILHGKRWSPILLGKPVL